MQSGDTIAAPATPATAAVRAIVRTSGPEAFDLAARLAAHQWTMALAHGVACPCRLHLDEDVDLPATLYAFRAPRSSTGEDVVEYHVPGSPFLASLLLRRLFALGARRAEPGEFTARAYFNGKLDLSRAEGVAATIAAASRQQLDAARQLLAGELSRRLTPMIDTLANTLALVEVEIDFSDEDVSFISRDEVRASIGRTAEGLRQLLRESDRIDRLSHEPRIVLAGRPNAGKSTLLNALARGERAVVSDVAGTTRDALSARVALARGYVTLVDVAGLEDAADDGDLIANQMRAAALRELEQADAVVHLVDATDERLPLELPRTPDIVVRTKVDLGPPPADTIGISAVTGAGLERLLDRLDALAFGTTATDTAGKLALTGRHVTDLGSAVAALARAGGAVDAGAELVAHELRSAVDSLGRILGTISPDDVLGRIFSSFCIGK